jgi:metallo-beta-lactamase class B
MLLMLSAGHVAAQPATDLDNLHGPAWSGAVEPFRVVGNIYYVGATNIASYLIVTPAGHILLDTGTPEMIPVVRGSIEKLGFKLTDVKIILSGHAHFDHVGGHAAMKRATGAKVMALAQDAPALAAGKDLSPLQAEGWEPIEVDEVLENGDTVTLGDTKLRAVLAPGHTPGCTMWTTQTRERERGAARSYAVLFAACMGPNQQVQLLDNPAFPNLVAQTRGGFRRLRKLAPDMYLTMHPKEQFEGKVERIVAGETPHPLHDPSGWRKLLDQTQASFEARVRAQRAARASGTKSEKTRSVR